MITEITDVLNHPIGTWCCYHVGFLAKDRGGNKMPRELSPDESAVNDTAAIAWKLYEQKRVVLLQKRVGFLKWEYLAQRVA